MCLTPCSAATEFSILRATAVSSCAGAAPGSEAETMTIGRSMSGMFWIFMARKPMRPASVKSRNNRMAGIGLRIDQEDTLIMSVSPALDDAHEIAVGKETDAGADHCHAGFQTVCHCHPVAGALSDAHFGLDHPIVRSQSEHVAVTVA